MDQAVIVFSFPYTEDKVKLGLIIEKAQESFKDMPNVKGSLAIDKAAARINAILSGEYDEKLMRRAVKIDELTIVEDQENGQ